MAAALIKYETIDSGQIKDIMDGKEPRPPEDWGESDDSASGKDSETPESESTGSIGGPASEH